MHIDNLYRDQRILLFRECYALEKIHGTSARVAWRDGHVLYSPGGMGQQDFRGIFDAPVLQACFERLGHPVVVVYGEAYGGKEQQQGWRYGERYRFVAWDVQIGDLFLAVPSAHAVVTKLGLEFVHYARVSTDLTAIDAERDAPSEQARRNGVVGDKPREGVVLRPLVEVTSNDGRRFNAKHKRAEERETATHREIVDPSKLVVLERADDIAEEWVTPMRLQHVLDHLAAASVAATPQTIVDAMVEDVTREAAGEIVDSKAARKAIGAKAVALFFASKKGRT